jgi:hypothetical protein
MKFKSDFKDINNENIYLGDFVTFKKDNEILDGYIDYFPGIDKFAIISKYKDNFKAYPLEDYIKSCKIIKKENK